MKKTKHANGAGTITKRKDGRYEARISLGQGKRRSFYGPSWADVHRQLTAAKKAQDEDKPIPSRSVTVGRYLTEWLDGIRSTLKPTTYIRYEEYVRLHAIPSIGKLRLAQLSPAHLRRLYAEKQEPGGDGRPALSETSVHHLHAVLHAAFRQAVLDHLRTWNVADAVKAPSGGRRNMKTLDPEQARGFMRAAEGDRFEALYVLALTTGMRRGELLALHWRDIDLDGRTAIVQGTLQRVSAKAAEKMRLTPGLVISDPKTEGSRRSVSLPDVAIGVLRGHLIAQRQERERMGEAWQDQDLVFTNEIGGPVEARNVMRRSFEPLLKRAGITGFRFHDLRHTAATLLLRQGIPAKIVSEQLGHTQISTTLDLYSHVTEGMRRQAADAMEAALGRGNSGGA